MRIYALERDIERLQSRLTSVEEDYADAEKSLEAVRADLRAAEGRVEELEAKLLAAEKAREEAEGELGSNFKDAGMTLAEAITHMQRLLDEKTVHHAAAESRAARLAEKVRRIESACGLPDPAEEEGRDE